MVIVSYSCTVDNEDLYIYFFFWESGSLEKSKQLKQYEVLITFRSGHLMYKIVFNDFMKSVNFVIIL